MLQCVRCYVELPMTSSINAQVRTMFSIFELDNCDNVLLDSTLTTNDVDNKNDNLVRVHASDKMDCGVEV